MEHRCALAGKHQSGGCFCNSANFVLRDVRGGLSQGAIGKYVWHPCRTAYVNYVHLPVPQPGSGVQGGVEEETEGLTPAPTRCGCHKLLIKLGKRARGTVSRKILRYSYSFYGKSQFLSNYRRKYPALITTTIMFYL
jgi:hypothetical protein